MQILLKHHFTSCLYFLVLILLSAAADAKDAQMLLSPTRVVLEGKERYATVTVKNPGGASGRYRAKLVDTIMLENGAVKTLEEDETGTHSAKSMLRLSPRSMTLRPGENQSIRILVRKPKNLEAGEYRSHLSVKLVEANVEARQAEAAGAQAPQIAIRPKLVMVIPVIVRHGEIQTTVTIPEASLNTSSKQPTVDLTLAWEGNGSTIGDMRITHVDSSGKETLLKQHPGVAIYRDTPRRKLSLPLDVPAGTSLKSGKLVIHYNSQGEAPTAIAKTEVML